MCLAVAFVTSIAMNGLAAAGVFGKDIGVISDENPTFVTPDGVTFAVWGLIYTLLTILVCSQFCPSENAETLLAQKGVMGLDVRQRLSIAFLLNAIWLPIYVNEFFWTALAVIASYLVALASVYMDLTTKRTTSFFEWLAYAAPVATNASWVTVATFANIFTCLGAAGWKDEFGVAGSAPAAMAVVVLVALLASWLVVTNRSVMWSSVAAWALMGIYRMQTIADAESFPVKAMSQNLAYTAFACAIVSACSTIVALILIVRDRSGGNKQDEAFTSTSSE